MAVPTSYTVAPGDNLSKIARQHGLKSWKLLYYAPVNAAFRKTHPNPDTIHPGSKILIPPDPNAEVARLRRRLDELRKLRREISQFGEHGEKQLRASGREINSYGKKLDAFATVALLFADLGKLVHKGLKWNAAKGAAKKELNDEIVRGTVTGIAKKHADAAAIVISSSDGDSSSAAWLALKSVALAWCDITSPSFWANTAAQLRIDPTDPGTWSNLGDLDWSSWSTSVATRPEDLERQARQKWGRVMRSSLDRIDKQIREIEKALI